MSSTVVLTMADTATTTKGGGLDNCPNCGDTIPGIASSQSELSRAQARIADLEAEVRQLNDKATAAVGRWAEYEDELVKLRAAAAGGNTDTAKSAPASAEGPPPPPPKDENQSTPATPADDERRSSTGFLQGRLSALLGSRSNKSSPNLERYGRDERGPGHGHSSSADQQGPSTEQLLQALVREQSLRKEAEGRLVATSKEVEELSATLFEQANEMVAEERRARAKLEERVDELERRDGDKRRRLDTLEAAMARIESARKLIAQHDQQEADMNKDIEEEAAAEAAETKQEVKAAQ